MQTLLIKATYHESIPEGIQSKFLDFLDEACGCGPDKDCQMVAIATTTVEHKDTEFIDYEIIDIETGESNAPGA